MHALDAAVFRLYDAHVRREIDSLYNIIDTYIAIDFNAVYPSTAQSG